MGVTAERLAHTGMHSLLVWVLAANPARGFYEALGGQHVHTQAIDIGGLLYEEVAYGWTDLSGLMPKA